MNLTRKARCKLWISAALGAVSLAAFWPVTTCDFINYDDPAYVSANLRVMNGFSWQGVSWAFQPGFAGNWHPLTWFSHMLDAQLFGLNAGWHHFTSLLLHIANTILLFLLLARLTGKGQGIENSGAVWRSATVAALFALHPLHVESVAWISERKDVLSAFFFLLTLWAYARYAEEKAEARSPKTEGSPKAEIRNTGSSATITHHAFRITHSSPIFPLRSSISSLPSSSFYLLSLLFFTLGLMSKPMLVTVPFILLLLDYWPLGRWGAGTWGLRTTDHGPQVEGGTADHGSRITDHASLITHPSPPSIPQLQIPDLFREKLPFFILSALSCVMTFQAQSLGGAVRPLALLSLGQRFSNAIVSYAIYLKQAVWPSGLTVFYPLSDHTTATTSGAGAVLLAITTWAIAPLLAGTPLRGTRALPNPSVLAYRPWRLVGWFWFLGMLVPVIGLVQVGMQQTADRYTYLPLIGVFILVVWEVADWQVRKPKAEIRRKSEIRSLTEPASPQPQVFFPEKPGFWVPAYGLAVGGVLLACAVMTWKQAGYWHDSERLFRQALAVTPNNWLAHHSLGHALLEQGNEDAAIVEYQAAVAIEPRSEIHFILGETLSKQRRYDEAVAEFTELLKVSPDDAGALVQIGIARALQGRTDEAVQSLAEALRINPADPGAHNSLGNILAQQGRHEEAVKQFEEALRLKPDHAGALNNLAISCKKLGRMDKAIMHYREALRLEPDSLQALNNLAWTLAACPMDRLRNGAEAVQLATQACELTKYQNPIPLVTLAAAYAETGRFKEAISFAEQAQTIAGGGNSPLATRLQAMLEVFRGGKPYHGE
ncbi:MAG: tetratricopeptide repeat protein [Verrucomicrobiota bacterium]